VAPRVRGASALIGDIREVAPTGWYGDLTGLSEAKGRALLVRVADTVVEHTRNVFAP
jgi:creatinine amidohydrolase/Fe(II)-dependent formamide hydrolase-like protein